MDVEQKRALRPYRRLVFGAFFLFLGIAGALVLRGIIRHLDRLPAPEPHRKELRLDARALSACLDDLKKLHLGFKKGTATRFVETYESPTEARLKWTAFQTETEQKLIKMTSRCQGGDPEDPLGHAYLRADQAFADLIRMYSLLFERFVQEGVEAEILFMQAVKNAQNRNFD